jgi:hypothetical protein
MGVLYDLTIKHKDGRSVARGGTRTQFFMLSGINSFESCLPEVPHR